MAQSVIVLLATPSADHGVVSSSDSIAGREGLIGIPKVFNSSSERFLRISELIINLVHHR
jgi:hypothetical protein